MKKNNSRCYVGSEIGCLKRIIVQNPCVILHRLTNINKEDFLFDDVLDIDTAEKEHQDFCNILKNEGVEIFFLHNLLSEIIENQEAKEWLLNMQCSSNFLCRSISNEVKSFFSNQSAEFITNYLIGGILWKDLGYNYNQASHSLISHTISPMDFVLPPLPNHLFTRDSSTWIYNGVSLNPMAKHIRKRESTILSAIYKFHPIFTSCDFNFWSDNDHEDHNISNRIFWEGGDILIIGNGIVMIGVGDRTSVQGIEKLAKELLYKSPVDKIIVAELPKERSYIHLDSVLTMLDQNCFTFYPAIVNTMQIWQVTANNNHGLHIKKITESLFDYLAKQLSCKKLRLIPTGGDFFQMVREQWNSANNMLTIRPGVAVGYKSNYKTIENMRNAGIKVLTFAGSELSRGRGGARCMSCPFERDDL
jgi:arginine deiminase